MSALRRLGLGGAAGLAVILSFALLAVAAPWLAPYPGQGLGDPNVIAEDILKKCSTGACIKITGTVVESLGSGQSSEINALFIEILGEADPEKYPLQPHKYDNSN